MIDTPTWLEPMRLAAVTELTAGLLAEQSDSCCKLKVQTIQYAIGVLHLPTGV